MMPRRPRWLAGVLWSLRAWGRRLLGLPSAPVLVHEIRCPYCGTWVAPRRFDLLRMACRNCLTTLARPPRRSQGW